MNYLLIRARKLLLGNVKTYLHELIEIWDPKHLQFDEILIIIQIMMNWKTLLEMKACEISPWMTSLVNDKAL